ncbi:3-deoxy-7-phosphoheptulonate synthase [Kocuria rhizophila]|nr:3-deoxy-7-phosphoheptulonate synthase [Kocuria rhizophila]
MVNGFDFTEESRVHDPRRMLRGYHTSASTLNPDPRLHPGWFRGPAARARVEHGFCGEPRLRPNESMAREIDHAVRSTAACGSDFDALEDHRVFAGHEALPPGLRAGRRASTPARTCPYGTSATSCGSASARATSTAPDVDLLSRLRNPIGVKPAPAPPATTHCA